MVLTDLSSVLRTAREVRGKTQAEIAYRSRATRSLVSMLESGKRDNTTINTLLNMADALGFPLPFLMNLAERKLTRDELVMELVQYDLAIRRGTGG